MRVLQRLAGAGMGQQVATSRAFVGLLPGFANEEVAKLIKRSGCLKPGR